MEEASAVRVGIHPGIHPRQPMPTPASLVVKAKAILLPVRCLEQAQPRLTLVEARSAALALPQGQ